MIVTIDGSGRVVIPKPVREELGLAPGTSFDLVVGDIGITLELRHQEATVAIADDGLPVIVADGPVPTLDEILAIRDELRR
jgi:AbrB family looped-hinge helix DNA binding protein